MSDLPAFEELRGATLDDMEVDWRNGIVLVGFLPSATIKECRQLRATGITHVTIARGASASHLVKDVRRAAGGSGGTASVEITMQSGETLRIDATDFAVDVTAG